MLAYTVPVYNGSLTYTGIRIYRRTSVAGPILRREVKEWDPATHARFGQFPHITHDFKLDPRFERFLQQEEGQKATSTPSVTEHIKRVLGSFDVGDYGSQRHIASSPSPPSSFRFCSSLIFRSQSRHTSFPHSSIILFPSLTWVTSTITTQL